MKALKKGKKKKTPKGYDVSVGGNVDYNKPHEKTSFASSSKDRSIAGKKLSHKLSAAGVTGADLSSAQRKAKLTQGSSGKYTRSTEVSSPMDIKKHGGKIKVIKKSKPSPAYVSDKDRATALKKLNDKLRKEGFPSGSNDPRAPKFQLYQDEKTGVYNYRKV